MMDKDRLSRGLASQALAALAMLGDCLERCPEGEWEEARGDRPFSQVLFHALFDCDYLLSESEEAFRAQAFHREHRGRFGSYEELGDSPPGQSQEREFIRRYYEHCKAKVASTLEAKTEAELKAPDSDVTGTMTRLERTVNLTRHLQHHAAQLGLRLQLLTGVEMEWVGRGYQAEG